MGDRITVTDRGVKIPSPARWGMIWVPLGRIVDVTLMRVPKWGDPHDDATQLLIHATYPKHDSRGPLAFVTETKTIDYPTWVEAEADQARIQAAVKASKREVVL